MHASAKLNFGPYEVVDKIGEGGMAEVYLARTRGLAGFERYCALKVIHPRLASDDRFVQMLIEEAKIAVQLQHVNITQTFDLGMSQGRYYITMEYIEGANLAQILHALEGRSIPVPIDCAVYIARETCIALEYAHQRKDNHGRPLGIIHRDISPQNVMLSQAGEVKVVDFGIAKAFARSVQTRAGVVKGKYAYMSPEQAMGGQIDHRTDLFAVGVTLYEMLTGRILHWKDNPVSFEELRQLARAARVPKPTEVRPDIPAELESIILKALARRAQDRWQSACKMQIALTSFLSGHSPGFTPNRLAALLQTAGGQVTQEISTSAKRAPDQSTISFQALTRDDAPSDEHSVLAKIAPPSTRTDDTRPTDLVEFGLAQKPTETDDPPSSGALPATAPAVRVPIVLSNESTLAKLHHDRDGTRKTALDSQLGMPAISTEPDFPWLDPDHVKSVDSSPDGDRQVGVRDGTGQATRPASTEMNREQTTLVEAPNTPISDHHFLRDLMPRDDPTARVKSLPCPVLIPKPQPKVTPKVVALSLLLLAVVAVATYLVASA